MVNSNGTTAYKWRYVYIYLILLAALIILITRLVFLSVIDRNFLLNQGDARTLRLVEIPAYRGMIADRYGKPLAVSTPVDSIWVDPQKFSTDAENLSKLANLLGMSFDDLKQLLLKNRKREFVYLKRRLDPWLAGQIKNLRIPGVYLQPEFRRYYPEGEVTAHILGVTNIDDHGQEGLELAFDKWLTGVVGKKRVLKDRYGNVVEDVEALSSPKSGHNLILSIDRRIQYIAYKALQQGMTDNLADSGSIVVLDVKTGEILAMVNQPSYNPNQDVTKIDQSHRNRAVTDVYEPGSVIKTFSLANAIASGKYTTETKIDTHPGWWYIGRNSVKDEHDEGVITLRQILELSSDVGTAKVVLSLPPEPLWNLLHAVGFGAATSSGFPGERSGVLIKNSLTHPFQFATLAFGYSLNVTVLQLAQAYAVIANEGIKKPVTFLRVEQPVAGQRVLDATVAKSALSMLQSVVEADSLQATGRAAKVPNYHVAGKTGTSNIAIAHGYDKHRYNSTFVGFAPATNPRLVIAVMIRDPRGKKHLAAEVSAPVFSQVMAQALQLLDVLPDNLPDQGTVTTK